LKTSGSADIGYIGLACLTAQINGTVDVTGTLTLGADGKFTDNTVTKGSDTWGLDAACLNISGVKVTCDGIGNVFAATLSGFGYSDFKCVNAASGGGCTCQGTINSAGGLGLLYNDLTSTGKYTTAKNTLTLGADAVALSYCVSGNQMTATPKPSSSTSTPYTGSVVLEKSVGGTGGAGGSGGKSGGGTGGAGGSGGTSQSGSGGITATAGATSAGGKSGSGGSTVSGSGGAIGGNTGGGGGGGGGGGSGGGSHADGPGDDCSQAVDNMIALCTEKTLCPTSALYCRADLITACHSFSGSSSSSSGGGSLIDCLKAATSCDAVNKC
jgi:hypothetical protein